MTNWPTVEGGAEKQDTYVGGASATLLVSSESKQKEEAVEFAVFMSQKFSDYGYESGAHLPTWKYEGDVKLQDMQKNLTDLMENADGFCLAWDTLLDAETGDLCEADDSGTIYRGNDGNQEIIEFRQHNLYPIDYAAVLKAGRCCFG